MVDLLKVLARHPFFASLDAEALGAIARRARIRLYEKNSLLYLEGETVAGLYVVVSGQVRVFKTSADGREQDLFHVSVGESVNAASAFDGCPTMANAQATESSVVLLITRDTLAELMREHPQICAGMLRALAGRLRELADLAGDLSLRDVVSRMAGALLRLAGHRSVVELPARSELAAMVGTVREVGTRALRQLEASGAIRLERRSATILDRPRLERYRGQRWPSVS